MFAGWLCELLINQNFVELKCIKVLLNLKLLFSFNFCFSFSSVIEKIMSTFIKQSGPCWFYHLACFLMYFQVCLHAYLGHGGYCRVRNAALQVLSLPAAVASNREKTYAKVRKKSTWFGKIYQVNKAQK